MLFEIKFDIRETMKKNPGVKKDDIYKMAYNTYCVKFIETMRKNGFNLIEHKDDNNIYFGMEIPKGIEKKTKFKKLSKENKKIASKKEVEEAIKKAGDK